MRDLFPDNGLESAQDSQVLEASGVGADTAQDVRDALAGRQVCPFCGAILDQHASPCPRCTMENTSATRQGTKSRIGPWYVFQSRNPAAPGMKFQTLLSFVRKGRVKARSVVRGPTTHQLWRFAAHVKGLSREFGICYSCGGGIEREARLCPNCNRSQEPPADPDIFLEGQEPAPGAIPIFRDLGAAPMVAEDLSASAKGKRGQPGASDKPVPPRSTKQAKGRKSADGFLSPRELAAAFKLKFQPRGRAYQADASPWPISEDDAPPRRSRRGRRRIKRFLVLGTALAVVAAFVFLYQGSSGFRSAIQSGYDQASDWTHQKLDQWSAPGSRKSPPKVLIPPEYLKSSPSAAHQQPAATRPAAAQPDAASTSPGSEWDRLLGKSAQSTRP